MTTEAEIRSVFDTAFSMLKETFYKNYRIEEREQDNPPHILSLRDIIEALPPATQVIEIRGPSGHKFLKDGRGFLFKYDFDHLNSNYFEFCGTIDHNHPEKLVALLVEKFKLDEDEIKEYAKGLLREFNLTGRCSPPQSWYLHFIHEDVLKNPKAYYLALVFDFLSLPSVPILSEKFVRKEYPDYNKIFNLSSDPILPLEELLKDDRSSSFLNLNIEKLQEGVSHMQLIPNVPDNVKRAFKRAKDLFVFGYFKYEFFTISHHYAFLALEAAIKARYISSLGDVGLLTDRKKKEFTYEMNKPEYHRIKEFCRKGKKLGWNAHTLLVNGEPFPYSGNKLVEWLVNKHIIRKWEMRRYDAGLQLRNSLSHLERLSIHTPDSSLLESVSDQINYLFYSLHEQKQAR